MTFAVHFITGNRHKFSELADILPDLVQVDIDLPEVQAVDSRDVISAKLSTARGQMPGKAILVEDTALHLSCLNGFPGALIKWMLSSCGCDGICRLCAAMGDHRAEARTVLGYLAAGDSEPRFVDAVLAGRICAPAGNSGFGWDPIFIPTGYDVSLAELPETVLRSIKMRRKAAELFRDGILKGTGGSNEGGRV
jgi:non-canonical purine NTP pyrophosphatase (RdgB/HAM1 family)